MKEYRLNKSNNFIDGYYLSNLSICDSLIDLFEKSDNKCLGTTGQGVNKKIKDSLDLPSIFKNTNLLKLIMIGIVKKQICFRLKDI